MNNELMKREDGNVIPGLENVDPTEDIQIPRIKVSGKRGLFENKAMDTSTPKLECVLLTRYKTRTKFSPDNFVECKSMDRITGDPYGKCAECEFADQKDSKGKMLCQLMYEFLLMTDNSQIPYVMGVSSKSALGPFKRYISSFLVAGKPLFSVRTKMSFLEKDTEKDGERFSYFGLVLERGDEVDPKDQQIYLNILNKFRSVKSSDQDLPVEPEEDIDLGADLPF